MIANELKAGPPFDTDDPEPVVLHHWEVYFSSHFSFDNAQTVGTAPHFEINYGVAKNLQIHIIAPLALSIIKNGNIDYGYGDMELGFKYRFVNESEWCPQIGVFPLVEIPTGNADKGLGGGNVQIFIPLWFQKTFGKLTTYGGGGYWINPGPGNKNWQFYGLQAQYKITDNFSLGTELYHITANEQNGKGDTRFNLGSVIDLSNTSHILLSVGSSLNHNINFQSYIGYQLTFGKD